MSKDVITVNNYFRTALRRDVDELLAQIILSERQRKVFELYYIDRQNRGYIADTLNVCESVISEEIKEIRKKIVKIISK